MTPVSEQIRTQSPSRLLVVAAIVSITAVLAWVNVYVKSCNGNLRDQPPDRESVETPPEARLPIDDGEITTTPHDGTRPCGTEPPQTNGRDRYALLYVCRCDYLTHEMQR